MFVLRQAVTFVNQQLIRFRKYVLFTNNFAQLFDERVVRFKLCGTGRHGWIWFPKSLFDRGELMIHYAPDLLGARASPPQ